MRDTVTIRWASAIARLRLLWLAAKDLPLWVYVCTFVTFTTVGFISVMISVALDRPVRAITRDVSLTPAPIVLGREVASELTLREVAAGAQSPATVQSGPTRPVSSERFEDYTRGHQEKHDLEREALTRARETTELRLREMNNLRDQINTERGQYVTRLQYEAIADRMNKIEQAQSSMQGTNAGYVVALGIFFAVLQVALRFVLPQQKKDSETGR